MMEILSRKNIFFGICLITLIITMSLYNMDLLINEDFTNFTHWIGHRNSSILKKISDHHFENVQQSECPLPLQWTLERNSSNISQPMPVLPMKEDDMCLELLIKKHCYKDNRIVPNVVHYVNFGKGQIKLYLFLSLLATWKNIKPCFIVIHGDVISGPLFQKFLTYKPRVILANRAAKQKIFGKKISYIQHKADVARLEIIIKYGGIYLDQDQIVLKSFDPLRNHTVVLGQETDNQFGNAVIIAKPSAFFLKIWMNAYQSYNPNEWAVHSTMVPFKLAKLLSKLVYVVPTFFKPNYHNVVNLYNKNIDWSNFYAIHLYGKTRLNRETFETIRYRDTTFGSVARYIYYGDKTLQKKGTPTKKVKPANKVKPTEKVKPANKVKPTEKVKPANKVKPTEKVKPANKVKPTEKVKPAKKS